MDYSCPVCGFAGLEEPHRDKYGEPSFEICPSCGTEFGYHDAKRSHDELREEWVRNGARWHGHHGAPPGWDPIKQLTAAGLIAPSK